MAAQHLMFAGFNGKGVSAVGRFSGSYCKQTASTPPQTPNPFKPYTPKLSAKQSGLTGMVIGHRSQL
jgi:hypothetical protein